MKKLICILVLLLAFVCAFAACDAEAPRSITKSEIVNGELVLTYSDGTTENLGKVVGDDGAKGDKGETGAQGIQGDKGDKGDKGDTGATGATGAQGEKGDKGDTGEQGIQGVKGDKGETGATGAQGIQGDKGDKGDKGEKGDTGAQGEKGDTGATIAKVEFDEQGRLVITLTDGTALAPVEMPEKEEHQHIYQNWSVTTPATCGTKGVETGTCTCGATDTRKIPATGAHNYGTWRVTTPATCSTKGAEKRSCACGAFETKDIPATGECTYNTQNVCSVCNTALQYTEGLAYTLNEEGESYSVSRGTALENTTDVVIPGYYNEKPVTSIYSFAFVGCGLTSIRIPATVTEIDSMSFYACFDLTSIIVEKSNTTYCSNGNCVIERASKTLILGCKGSEIPSDGSVTSIGEGAFRECEGLKSIVIPSSVTSIGSGAFQGCTELLQEENGCYYVDNWLVDLDGSALSFVMRASTVGIAEGVITRGGSNTLTSITVESGNTKYHSDGNCLIETATGKILLGCQNSVIPADGSVTSIGDNAFSGCRGLTSIEIPNSVTSIGNYAFMGCRGLASITLSNSVKSIGGCAFSDAIITEITIPNSVTSIGNFAFSRCKNLTNVTIPASVKNIGVNPFAICSNLEGITVESGNTNYYVKENCLIEIASKNLISGCKNSVIPTDGSIVSIGIEAFSTFSSLTSVTISESVVSIGERAFANCSSLTSVTFENPNGWSAGSTAVSATDLADLAKAAQYLRFDDWNDGYSNYTWTRTEE